MRISAKRNVRVIFTCNQDEANVTYAIADWRVGKRLRSIHDEKKQIHISTANSSSPLGFSRFRMLTMCVRIFVLHFLIAGARIHNAHSSHIGQLSLGRLQLTIRNWQLTRKLDGINKLFSHELQSLHFL